MTAGANDANGAHSSLHTLESTSVLVVDCLIRQRLLFMASVQFVSSVHQINISLHHTIKPLGPFGPCIPAGPVSPGGPWKNTSKLFYFFWK